MNYTANKCLPFPKRLSLKEQKFDPRTTYRQLIHNCGKHLDNKRVVTSFNHNVNSWDSTERSTCPNIWDRIVNKDRNAASLKVNKR